MNRPRKVKIQNEFVRILFFDTSCDFILVGLYSLQNKEIKEEYFYAGNHPRESSYRLLSDIQLGLTSVSWEKPDVVSCAIGPGSFTGIRISVATARNLSQLWKIPNLGFDTIEMYSNFYSDFYKSPVITVLDGKQKKVFAGSFRNQSYKGTFDISPSEFETQFKEELETENRIIIADTNLVKSDFKIESQLPNPISILKRNISKLESLTLADNSYLTLHPKYMRNTYAHKE